MTDLVSDIFSDARELANPFYNETRHERVLNLISESLLLPDVDVSVIFSLAYGDAQGKDYWSNHILPQVSAFKFAHFLAVHWLKETAVAVPTIAVGEETAADVGPRRRMILERLTWAKDIWLTPTGQPPEYRASENNGVTEADMYKVSIDPRRAIYWMLEQPPLINALVPPAYREAQTEQECANHSRPEVVADAFVDKNRGSKHVGIKEILKERYGVLPDSEFPYKEFMKFLEFKLKMRPMPVKETVRQAVIAVQKEQGQVRPLA